LGHSWPAPATELEVAQCDLNGPTLSCARLDYLPFRHSEHGLFWCRVKTFSDEYEGGPVTIAVARRWQLGDQPLSGTIRGADALEPSTALARVVEAENGVKSGDPLPSEANGSALDPAATPALRADLPEEGG